MDASPAHTPPLPGIGPVLDVRQLTKVYGSGRAAVQDLSFTVARGEVFGLLGPNGAGKSTTMSMLTGTTTPTSGSAFVNGVGVSNSRDVRSQIGVAFQDSVLDSEFTGRENLRLHARLWGMAKSDGADRIDEMLGFMGLADRADDNVRTYSGGMRRRLELARALLARPSLVLLDEPTVGLDPAVRDEIWALISRMRDHEHISVVVSTHYLEEAEAACDRVGIMSHGHLVAVDSPTSLINQLGVETVEVTLVGDPAMVRSSLGPIGRRGSVRHNILTVPMADGGEQALADLLRSLRATNLPVARALLRRTTLADVFAALTTDASTDVEVGLNAEVAA
jgi:ABC-2 type transport system ATP-binding protein